MSVKGLPFIGKMNEFLGKVIHATLSKLGSSRAGLDVVNHGLALISDPILRITVEAGSTDSLIKVTGHSFKEGDRVRLYTTANNIVEEMMVVDEIIDANTVKIAGYLSASLTAGDVIEQYRPVMERLAPDGSSMATIAAAPLNFEVTSGSVTSVVNVKNDKDTPSLSNPLPVQLFGVNGTLSVTSDTIDVHMVHNGAQADSVAIGNGSNVTPAFWDIDASGAGLIRATDLDVRDLTALTDNVAIRNGANELAINASGEASINKTGLSTEAKQDASITSTNATTTAITNLHADVGDVTDPSQPDYTLSGTLISLTKGIISWLTSVRTRMDNAFLASQSGAWTVAVNNQPTDTATATLQGTGNTSLGSIKTNTDNLEARLDTLVTALNTLNSKIPVIGQQISAASQSVVLASDSAAISTQSPLNVNGTSSSVSLNASSSSFTAPVDAVGFVLKNQAESDETVYWSLGAVATINDQDLLAGQGTAFIPATTTVYVHSTGIAKVAIAWVRR